ncbi:hypothetical protein CO046_01795 [Candidatus Peregrinibacteria bacterium CG_4_9_14_0_2_um_filter_53_11]|nr:MAG: hypothetical protein CO046_01795 [Candidatus Peregrinibacteria bacterium CG_4_9_14_0_2_um_filter_53_11]
MSLRKTQFVLAAALALVFTVGSLSVGLSAQSLAASVMQSEDESEPQTYRALLRKRASAPTLSKTLVAELEKIEVAPYSCSYDRPDEVEYAGEFLITQLDKKGAPGETIASALYLKNTGNVPWFGDASDCVTEPFVRLGTARERDRKSSFFENGENTGWQGPNRIAMQEARVDPGHVATFRFESTLPTTPDLYKEYFQPVIEGKTWLENREATANVLFNVGGPHENLARSAFLLNHSGAASTLDLSGAPYIDVDLSQQITRVKYGEVVVREYLSSTGSFKTPTPVGRFSIINKQELRIGKAWPHYRMPEWQGFTKWGHGFHALPYLESDNGVFWEEALNHIGQRVSHGCIRLLNEDAADLSEITEIGWPIVIHY